MDVSAPVVPGNTSRIACDLDGTVLACPAFFRLFIAAMQACGCQVGILTDRPAADNEANLTMLAGLGITPSFYVGKPENTTLSDGAFKALACAALGIEVLFDDFEGNDPRMVADFCSGNGTTHCFTSWPELTGHPYTAPSNTMIEGGDTT